VNKSRGKERKTKKKKAGYRRRGKSGRVREIKGQTKIGRGIGKKKIPKKMTREKNHEWN